jgi:hypothetical protein
MDSIFADRGMSARMKRALLVAVLVTFALAPAASAAPIPIRHDRDATAIALAGPDVLVASESPQHGMKLVALPRTGGKARTLLSVPNAGLTLDQGVLAASAQRVALLVDIDERKGRPTEHRVYSGPPSGPLQLVRRTQDPNGDAWTPFAVSVDGDRMLLVEGIPVNSDDDDDEEDSFGPVRASILDASGWFTVPWVTSTRVPVAIAGPYAAVAALGPKRFEVADLATGAPRTTLNATWSQEGGLTVDLTADGRIAVAVQDGIETASLGQAAQTLPDSKSLAFPHFAGGSLAVFDDTRNTLDLIRAGGKPKPLGPRSLIRTDMDADDQGLAWLFNGCVRYEPFGKSEKRGDACPTSEVALWTIGPSSKLRGNTATAQVKCVTSVSGRCRGRLVARSDIGKPIIGRGTFDIPVGDRWHKVPVHFDRRTVLKFRREHFGGVVINAIVRHGTVGSGADYSSEFEVKPDQS